MEYTLKLIFALIILIMSIKVLMNLINLVGIDFVGFFEDLWKKIRKYK